MILIIIYIHSVPQYDGTFIASGLTTSWTFVQIHYGEWGMPNTELWAGALSLMVRYAETGCAQSGRQAARLLDRIADMPGIDQETGVLLERASLRLADQTKGGGHVCALQA